MNDATDACTDMRLLRNCVGGLEKHLKTSNVEKL
jgi:hypothetical protein